MVKQQTKMSIAKVQTNITKRGRGVKSAVPFPRHSLKESLTIPRTIWEKNAGAPYDPIKVAQALGTSVRSSRFSMLLTSSERYGLTQGGVFAKSVSLT